MIASESLKPAHSKRGRHLHLGDVLGILLIIVLCLSIGLPRYCSGIDLGDEGFLAHGADRVNAGQLPHRDFVSLQPPLSFYTAAAVFKLFGTSLTSLRILGLGIYLLVPLLIYGIARTAIKPPLALVAAIPTIFVGIPFFNFVPFAAWQGIAATLAAVLFFLWAIRGDRWRELLALTSGIVTAASLLLRHDQGLYLVISLSVYALALHRARDRSSSDTTLKRVFAFWLVGVVVVLLPLGVYWQMQDALPQMFQQLVVFPITTYTTTSSLPFPPFSAEILSLQNVLATFFYLPPLMVLITAAWLVRQIRRSQFHCREAFLVFLVVWTGLYYCQVLTRSDLNHLLITLPPFLILAACGWKVFLNQLDEWSLRWPHCQRRAFLAKVTASILIGTLGIGFLCLTKPVFLPDPPKAEEMIQLGRAGVRSDIAQRLKNLVRNVQNHVPADRAILCLPYQPMFYFLCERRNPTRWNYLWPGDQMPEDHEALIQQAKADPPAIVLIMKEDVMRRYAPALLDYVHVGYRAVGTNGELVIYAP